MAGRLNARLDRIEGKFPEPKRFFFFLNLMPTEPTAWQWDDLEFRRAPGESREDFFARMQREIAASLPPTRSPLPLFLIPKPIYDAEQSPTTRTEPER